MEFDESKLKALIYELVCSAEYQIKGTKQGQVRKAQVIKTLKSLLPKEYQELITDELIGELIDLCCNLMNQSLQP